MNTTDALLMAAFGGKKTVIIPRKEINFLDIKGNVFRAYDKTQFLALTEMPNPPSADGMKPRGWNWTLPEAKAAVEANGTLDVAPEYDTQQGLMQKPGQTPSRRATATKFTALMRR